MNKAPLIKANKNNEVRLGDIAYHVDTYFEPTIQIQWNDGSIQTFNHDVYHGHCELCGSFTSVTLRLVDTNIEVSADNHYSDKSEFCFADFNSSAK